MTTKLFRLTSFTLGILMFLTFAVMVSVNAVSISPSSGSFAAGSTQTFTIVANPPATGYNAAAVNLTFGGMTVTGYTPPSGGEFVIPGCTGGTNFTSTQVCINIAATDDFVAGDSLGTVTVTVGSGTTASITKDSGTEYTGVGVSTVASTGSAGNYTITSSTSGGTTTNGGSVTVLPNTATNNSSSIGLVLAGLTFLSLGALSYVSIDAIRRG
ncbi:hypothetical protein KC678_02185 [Candidatus Dojkabacteria bacterium]|uniref:Uncharacterized protein n=1 Tax=Candidatus Dojkabacteria bacterium TaxID=2099670 RepID=A0A955L1B0_9BACT|nr:hypothetical protein [Candidatus Dojkabacteria bacterium]